MGTVPKAGGTYILGRWVGTYRPEFLFLDVLSVEVEVELVQIIDSPTKLLPTVVIGVQQIFFSCLSHL